MVTINLKSRFRNKAFLVAFASAIVLLLQQIGLKQYIPSNWPETLNAFLTVLIMLGIVVDTSTPGISDKVVANTTVQAINSEQTKEEVKTEASTLAINNTITENSQNDSGSSSNTLILDNSTSSKIKVDNPDNIQEAGQEVNAKAATSPSLN
jgi:uncharacterized membrane protein